MSKILDEKLNNIQRTIKRLREKLEKKMGGNDKNIDRAMLSIENIEKMFLVLNHSNTTSDERKTYEKEIKEHFSMLVSKSDNGEKSYKVNEIDDSHHESNKKIKKHLDVILASHEEAEKDYIELLKLTQQVDNQMPDKNSSLLINILEQCDILIKLSTDEPLTNKNYKEKKSGYLNDYILNNSVDAFSVDTDEIAEDIDTLNEINKNLSQEISTRVKKKCINFLKWKEKNPLQDPEENVSEFLQIIEMYSTLAKNKENDSALDQKIHPLIANHLIESPHKSFKITPLSSSVNKLLENITSIYNENIKTLRSSTNDISNQKDASSKKTWNNENIKTLQSSTNDISNQKDASSKKTWNRASKVLTGFGLPLILTGGSTLGIGVAVSLGALTVALGPISPLILMAAGGAILAVGVVVAIAAVATRLAGKNVETETGAYKANTSTLTKNTTQNDSLSANKQEVSGPASEQAPGSIATQQGNSGTNLSNMPWHKKDNNLSTVEDKMRLEAEENDYSEGELEEINLDSSSTEDSEDALKNKK